MSTENQPTVPTPSVVFEGFYLQMVVSGQEARARQIVNDALGPDWGLRAVPDTSTDFEVSGTRGDGQSLSVKEAWEMTYRLRTTPGLINAEPLFGVPVGSPVRGEVPEGFPPTNVSGLERPHLPESEDAEWSLKQMRIAEAWAAFAGTGKTPGEGVIVGHPDTGYRRHPEITGNLLVEQGHDFVKGDADAEDELISGTLMFPGHGTGTASVIVSPSQGQDQYPSGRAVSGIAPGARLIPCRVAPTVLLLSPTNLSAAIELLTDRGAHVISISMGTGFFNKRLLVAVQYAQRRGVIVCAAAGNYVGYVVWPAAYDEVLAVAASNARGNVWWASSHGSAVDVTAPGESVWRAEVSQRDGGIVYDVLRSSGTSYSVAAVAGIAALWLSYHGRDALVNRYGAEKIPFIFNQILRMSCEEIPLALAGQYGAGLVNAEKVLRAPLPDGVNTLVGPAAFALTKNVAVDSGDLTTFTHLFEPALGAGDGGTSATVDQARARLQTRLSELLGTTEGELPARLREVGQELAFHFAADPDLYLQFAAALSGASPAGFTAGGEAAPAPLASVRGRLWARGASEALKSKTAP